MTVAKNYLRNIDPENRFLEETEIHMHVPEGATPKDGPSAGVTLTTSLLSLALKRPIDPHIGMTGEISLTGKVLPIGGVKEKTMSAVREGLTTLIFPWENKYDVEKLPENVRSGVTFHFAKDYSDVYRVCFPSD